MKHCEYAVHNPTKVLNDSLVEEVKLADWSEQLKQRPWAPEVQCASMLRQTHADRCEVTAVTEARARRRFIGSPCATETDLTTERIRQPSVAASG